MNSHVSTLELDEAAAGLAAPGVTAHVEACGACRSRLEAISRGAASVRDTAGFAKTLARLPAGKKRGAAPWVLAFAAAASVALAFAIPARQRLVAKGSATLSLKPAGELRAGQRAQLSFSAGAHRYARIVALDESGAEALLWPASLGASGAIPPGSHGVVELQVTPGATRIVGYFADSPVSADGAADHLELRELWIRPAR